VKAIDEIIEDAFSKEVGTTNFVGNILSTIFCALISSEFVENILSTNFCAPAKQNLWEKYFPQVSVPPP
jgi:hypothetical protein